MDETNEIDFSFLDHEERKFSYSVMIILNSNFDKDQYTLLKRKSDYAICVDDALNEVYNKFFSEGEMQIDDLSIDLIWCERDNIKKEVLDFYINKNIKQMYKNEYSTFDLDKCLYYSLEKISENVPHDSYSLDHNKTSAIFILGVSDGRLDHTFSVLQNVHKYIGSNFAMKTEFYMVSKSSMTVFLKNGANSIKPSEKYLNRGDGYSLVPLQDNINIKLVEYQGESKLDEMQKKTTFGCVIHRKKFKGDLIKVHADAISIGYLLYCCTTFNSL